MQASKQKYEIRANSDNNAHFIQVHIRFTHGTAKCSVHVSAVSASAIHRIPSNMPPERAKTIASMSMQEGRIPDLFLFFSFRGFGGVWFVLYVFFVCFFFLLHLLNPTFLHELIFSLLKHFAGLRKGNINGWQQQKSRVGVKFPLQPNQTGKYAPIVQRLLDSRKKFFWPQKCSSLTLHWVHEILCSR